MSAAATMNSGDATRGLCGFDLRLVTPSNDVKLLLRGLSFHRAPLGELSRAAAPPIPAVFTLDWVGRPAAAAAAPATRRVLLAAEGGADSLVGAVGSTELLQLTRQRASQLHEEQVSGVRDFDSVVWLLADREPPLSSAPARFAERAAALIRLACASSELAHPLPLVVLTVGATSAWASVDGAAPLNCAGSASLWGAARAPGSRLPTLLSCVDLPRADADALRSV